MLQLFINSNFRHQKELPHKSPDWSLFKMVNSWALWSLHYVSSQHCQNILLCIWHVGNWNAGTEWPTQDHRGNVLQLCLIGMPVKELCWPWYKAEISLNHKEKKLTFFFPNTAEQTPSKYQGSVKFSETTSFWQEIQTDIILLLVFLLLETKCSNPVCLPYVEEQQEIDFWRPV